MKASCGIVTDPHSSSAFWPSGFAAHVAAVALGEDVFAEGLDGFAGDDLAADGGLDGDFELVAGDLLAEFGAQGTAALLGPFLVDDRGEGLDGVAVDEDVEPICRRGSR
jgi:hypothetical protein